MTRKIWVYRLIGQVTTLDLPKNATIIRAHERYDRVAIWVNFDTALATDTEKVTFTSYGTGDEIPDDAGEYVDSAFVHGYVWHIFARNGV